MRIACARRRARAVASNLPDLTRKGSRRQRTFSSFYFHRSALKFLENNKINPLVCRDYALDDTMGTKF